MLRGQSTWIYRYALTQDELDPMGVNKLGRSVFKATEGVTAMMDLVAAPATRWIRVPDLTVITTSSRLMTPPRSSNSGCEKHALTLISDLVAPGASSHPNNRFLLVLTQSHFWPLTPG